MKRDVCPLEFGQYGGVGLLTMKRSKEPLLVPHDGVEHMSTRKRFAKSDHVSPPA